MRPAPISSSVPSGRRRGDKLWLQHSSPRWEQPFSVFTAVPLEKSFPQPIHYHGLKDCYWRPTASTPFNNQEKKTRLFQAEQGEVRRVRAPRLVPTVTVRQQRRVSQTAVVMPHRRSFLAVSHWISTATSLVSTRPVAFVTRLRVSGGVTRRRSTRG